MQARKHPVITHAPSPLPCKDTLPSFLPRVSNLSEEPIPGAWLPLCVGPIALVRAGGHHSEQPPQGVPHSRLPLYLTVRGMGSEAPGFLEGSKRCFLTSRVSGPLHQGCPVLLTSLGMHSSLSTTCSTQFFLLLLVLTLDCPILCTGTTGFSSESPLIQLVCGGSSNSV